MEYILQIMKDMEMGSYRDLMELSFDREDWRAVVNQLRDRKPKTKEEICD